MSVVLISFLTLLEYILPVRAKLAVCLILVVVVKLCSSFSHDCLGNLLLSV